MKIKNAYFIGLLVGLFCHINFAKAHPMVTHWDVISPNGLNKISLNLKNHRLYYTVLQNNDTLVRKSILGLIGKEADFSKGLFFKSVYTDKIVENYTLKIGKRLINSNIANEKTLTFYNQQKRLISIVFRAYNDGVAFRYQLPNAQKPVTLIDEITSFKIPENGKTWMMPYGKPTEWSPAYEEDFTNGEAVGETSRFTSGWSFPALFQIRNHFVLITEAGFETQYFASHLKADAPNGNYTIEKPLPSEAGSLYNQALILKSGFKSPWRTFIFGKSVGSIIQSNLVYDLSEKNKLADTSWIKPGRSSWSWWGDHESSKSYHKLTKFIDLSKEMGWEYSMVDANWDIMTDGGKIEDLAKYAQEKNISLGVWYNSGGPHNTSTERPRDLLSTSESRRAQFEKLEKWGIKLIKVDFFNSDKQPLIKLYEDILKDAAQYHIMVDFHGCTLPKGWSKTYPNLVTMEAIKGAEQYAYDKKFSKNAPSHNVIAMFTRNVVGPMDYTPVTFSNYDTVAHTTTNAHELALSILFESGMLHFADRVDAYTSLSPEIKNFLRIVPTTWNETKFVEGYPGKLMVLARRKKEDWFIGGANGENMNKTISLDLSFLPKGNYTLQIMKDGDNNRAINTNIIKYVSGEPVSINLLANGGFTVWAKKLK